jgi:hypothetical protein
MSETWDHLRETIEELRKENERLNKLINTPHVENFLEAVRLEAGHQQDRWKAEHDAGKADPDWFWLVGFLAGKILRPGNTQEKRLHHIITTAAVCLNWHRHASGDMTGMRPGIEPPPMAQAEALAEARRRWGDKGNVYDRAIAPEVEWMAGRYWVGAPDGNWNPDTGATHPYGNGDTWEAAFADADRRALEIANGRT